MKQTTRQFIVSSSTDFREILIAEFAAMGFDSFQETDEGFIAHTDNLVDIAEVAGVIARYVDTAGASMKVEEIEKVNWNEEWEESYDPIVLANKILVRASFHDPQPDIPYELIINPKMSFGTGHHETTGLMMKAQLSLDHKNKKVLEAGCGTGILTILAGKLGAAELYAYDNDEWVKDNIQENLKNNGTAARVSIGTIETLDLPNDFDIILANINKNILLNDIPFYSQKLNKDGVLLLSGFYESDLDEIRLATSKEDLNYVNSLTRNGWMAAHFLK